MVCPRPVQIKLEYSLCPITPSFLFKDCVTVHWDSTIIQAIRPFHKYAVFAPKCCCPNVHFSSKIYPCIFDLPFLSLFRIGLPGGSLQNTILCDAKYWAIDTCVVRYYYHSYTRQRPLYQTVRLNTGLRATLIQKFYPVLSYYHHLGVVIFVSDWVLCNSFIRHVYVQ